MHNACVLVITQHALHGACLGVPLCCRLASKCDMQGADVQALLSTMLQELGCEDFCLRMQFLKSMDLGKYLSTAETLVLLTKVAKGKKGYVLCCAETHAALAQLLVQLTRCYVAIIAFSLLC